MAEAPDLRGRIVAQRNDRMGGRLISIVNAIRISRDYGLPFVVAWVSHGRTAPELRNPADIFSQDFIDAHFVPGDLGAEIWASLEDLDATGIESAEALHAAAKAGRGFLSQRSVGATVLPWEAEEDAAPILAEAFEAIGFCDAIRRVEARIAARLAGTRLVAYHIRRGDIISNPVTSQRLWPTKYIPREFYEVHLARQLADPEAACLVFSDTRHEVDRLKALDPRVLAFDDLVGDEELLAGQRDFLELFAMSRCREIYGPPHSAFSQTAATLGGGIVRPVAETLSEAEQAQAVELLIARMEEPETHFLGDGDLGQCFPFVIRHLEGQGQAGKARELLAAQVNRGFSKPYVFPALSELSVSCGDLAACRTVRRAAWERPVTGDAALCSVAAHAAVAHLEAGEAQESHKWAQAAWWLGPMERVLPGVLSLLLSAGWLGLAPSYPIDARMVRRRGAAFPGRDPHLARMNAVSPPEGWGPDGIRSYPWEVALRDWAAIHGKRVGRGYWNRARIANALKRLEKAYSGRAGSPELGSAASVMLRELGELDEARARNRVALQAWPQDSLYIKREAEILLASGDLAAGISRLEDAAEASGGDLCYRALLGHCYGQARRPNEMAKVFAELAAREHDLVEIHLMTAEALRRREASRLQALASIDKAMALGHSSQRLQAAKARILGEMGRLDEAAVLYLAMAESGVAPVNVFAQMYRLFDRAGALATAEAVIAVSPYPLDEIRALIAE